MASRKPEIPTEGPGHCKHVVRSVYRKVDPQTGVTGTYMDVVLAKSLSRESEPQIGQNHIHNQSPTSYTIRGVPFQRVSTSRTSSYDLERA